MTARTDRLGNPSHLSEREKLRRAVLADVAEHGGTWTRVDAFRFSRSHGRQQATFAALNQLVVAQRLTHHPALRGASPERWELP